MYKKIFNMLFGNGMFALSQLFVFVFISRAWGVEDLGGYVYAIAISTPVYMFFNFGMRNSISSDQMYTEEDTVYIIARIFYSALSALIIWLILVWNIDESLILLGVSVVFLKLSESNLDIGFGKLQRQQLFSVIRNINAFRSISSVILFVAFYYLGFELYSIIFLVSCVWFFCYLYIVFAYSSINYGLLLEKKTIIRMYRLTEFCFPLGLMITFSSVNLNLPRIYLEKFSGVHDLALYSSLYQIVFLGTVVFTAIGQAIVPRLSRLIIAKDINKWISIVFKFNVLNLAVSIFLGVFFYINGEVVMAYIFGNEMVFEKRYFLYVAMICFLSYALNILSYALQSLRYYKGLILLSLIMTCIHFVVSFYAVKNYEVLGAFFGSIFFMTLYGLSLGFLVKRSVDKLNGDMV